MQIRRCPAFPKLVHLFLMIIFTGALSAQTVSRGDSTSLFTRLTREDIQKLPVTGLLELLTTQASILDVSGRGFAGHDFLSRGIPDVRMRGGRPGEIALVIDGIQTDSQMLGTIDQWVDVYDIESISFRPGGSDVRYGNALSGVIDIRTREPSKEFTGYADYRSSEPFRSDLLSAGNDRELDHHSLKWGLSGPLPYYDRIRIKASGAFRIQKDAVYELDGVIWDDYRDTDGDGLPDFPSSQEIMEAYAYNELMLVTSHEAGAVTGPDGRYINPLDNRKGWLGLGWDNTFDAGIDLSYDISESMKLRAGYRHNQTYEQPAPDNARYLYHWPVGDYMYIRPSRLNENIQPMQFIESDDPVKQSYSWNITGMGSAPVNFRSADRWFLQFSHQPSENIEYTAQFQYFRQKRKTRMLTGYDRRFASGSWVFEPDWDRVTKRWRYNIPNVYGYNDPWEGYFRMQYSSDLYDMEETDTYTGSIDMTGRLSDRQTIGMGIEFRCININNEYYDPSLSALDYSWITGASHPNEGAFYIHHELGFDRLYVQAGLRMDFFQTKEEMWANPFDPLALQDPTNIALEYTGFSDNTGDFTFSPRIALLFPVSETATAFANAGIYRQFPNYRDVYRACGEFRELRLTQGGNPLIGNSSLEPERAVKFEFGITQRLPLEFRMQAAYWSKETNNQAGSVLVPSYSDPGKDNPYYYSVLVNNNYGSARGFGLQISRKTGGAVSGRLHYSYSRARTYMATSWDGYLNRWRPETMPESDAVAPWDRPHTLRANIDVDAGKLDLPDFPGKKYLDGAGLNLMYYAESGLLYTPDQSSGGVSGGAENRMPFTHRVDLLLRKDIPGRFFTSRWYVMVENLFDRKNAFDVFPATGQPDDPGGTSMNNSVTYWDGITADNNGIRRTVNMGVRILW